MSNETPIIKSSTPMILQMVVISIIGGVLFLLVSGILRAIGDIINFDASNLGNLVRLFVLLLVILAILSVYVNAQKISYSISATSLSVITSSLFGNKQKQIHSIAALTSITIDQSSFGTRYSYGDIVLNLDRLGVNEQIVLKNIEHPNAVVKDIRSKVKTNNKK
jgi:hypothetical protein